MSLADVATYLDGPFASVEGWSVAQLWNLIDPLHEYQQRQGLSGPIAEIGVYHGKFFIALALLKAGEGRHAAIDVFDMQRFNLDGAGRGNLEKFRENLARCGVPEADVVMRPADSMSLKTPDIAAIREAHGPFAMFSVDGCHMAEHTINDFRIAMELTHPAGIVFVDDYLNADWPGVQEGMARLYLNDCPRFVPLAYAGNKLVTCNLSYHREYLAHLRKALPARYPQDRLKEVRRFGYDCLNVRLPPNGPALAPR